MLGRYIQREIISWQMLALANFTLLQFEDVLSAREVRSITNLIFVAEFFFSPLFSETSTVIKLLCNMTVSDEEEAICATETSFSRNNLNAAKGSMAVFFWGGSHPPYCFPLRSRRKSKQKKSRRNRRYYRKSVGHCCVLISLLSSYL